MGLRHGFAGAFCTTDQARPAAVAASGRVRRRPCRSGLRKLVVQINLHERPLGDLVDKCGGAYGLFSTPALGAKLLR